MFLREDCYRAEGAFRKVWPQSDVGFWCVFRYIYIYTWVTRGTLGNSRTYVVSKIGPSAPAIHSSFPQLKIEKIPRRCTSPDFGCTRPLRVVKDNERRPLFWAMKSPIWPIVFITAPVALPEAPPCRARLALVLSRFSEILPCRIWGFGHGPNGFCEH